MFLVKKAKLVLELNIEIIIEFLLNRVKNPTSEDKIKLEIILSHLLFFIENCILSCSTEHKNANNDKSKSVGSTFNNNNNNLQHASLLH